MFNRKYKRTLEILEKEIEEAWDAHQALLREIDKREETQTEEGRLRDLTERGGIWSKVDYYQARMDALCDLYRSLNQEFGEPK